MSFRVPERRQTVLSRTPCTRSRISFQSLLELLKVTLSYYDCTAHQDLKYYPKSTSYNPTHSLVSSASADWNVKPQNSSIPNSWICPIIAWPLFVTCAEWLIFWWLALVWITVSLSCAEGCWTDVGGCAKRRAACLRNQSQRLLDKLWWWQLFALTCKLRPYPLSGTRRTHFHSFWIASKSWFMRQVTWSVADHWSGGDAGPTSTTPPTPMRGEPKYSNDSSTCLYFGATWGATR